MPYRHAWRVIAALIAMTTFAFWPSYFGKLSTASTGFHVHGVTASLWLLLLLAQSWTAQRGGLAVHRLAGRVTFVAVPLFAAGSMGVMHSMAMGTVGGDPFYALWGGPLAFIDLLAFGAFLFATGMALRHRRNVRLHAGYMLSTALLLLSPVLGRVINQTIPGLTIRGPQDFPVFGPGVQLANVVAALVACWLWRRDPQHGRPWVIALGVVVVQIAAFDTFAAGDAWRAIFVAVGTQPLAMLMAVGLFAGIVTVGAGWLAPAVRSKARPAAA